MAHTSGGSPPAGSFGSFNPVPLSEGRNGSSKAERKSAKQVREESYQRSGVFRRKFKAHNRRRTWLVG